MTVNCKSLGVQLYDYCAKYKVPIEKIFQILEDQKVVPMIRGKATEYTVYIKLMEILSDNEWSIVKLNLNAQTNSDDEDICITHKRTGIIIRVESKNASRGSFKSGRNGKKFKEPHCTIKCHKSRSSIKKVGKGNDMYSADAFDIIISNLSNSIIAGKTYSENFELISDIECLQILSRHYNVPETFDDIFDATYDDWRFAKTSDLAKDNFLPRTPPLFLDGDKTWRPIDELEAALLQIVGLKRKN